MDDHSKVNANEVRMPQPLVWAICAICLVPFLLNLGGIQFGSTRLALDPAYIASLAPHQLVDTSGQRWSGPAGSCPELGCMRAA